MIREKGGLASLIDMTRIEVRDFFGEEQDAASALLAVRETLRAALFESVSRAALDPSDPSFLKYLLMMLSHRKTEVLIGFFADSDGGFIAQETLVDSDGHLVTLSPKSILSCALRHGAAKVLLVHNHPSGDCRASPPDIRDTKRICEMAEVIGIEIVDHLIVGGRSVYSILKRQRFDVVPFDDGPDRPD